MENRKITTWWKIITYCYVLALGLSMFLLPAVAMYTLMFDVEITGLIINFSFIVFLIAVGFYLNKKFETSASFLFSKEGTEDKA